MILSQTDAKQKSRPIPNPLLWSSAAAVWREDLLQQIASHNLTLTLGSAPKIMN